MNIQGKTKEALINEMRELVQENNSLKGFKEKEAAALIIANKELHFQNEEKEKRAAELVIANKELQFQNDEKVKRVDELAIITAEANRTTHLLQVHQIELEMQNEELKSALALAKYAAELDLVNKEISIRLEEKIRQNREQISLNTMLAFQRDRLAEIASLVPGVVYQYRLHPDGTSCFPYASEALKQIYRVSPEEVIEDATKVFANIHPDDFDGVITSIQNSAKELCPWQQEYRVKFEDGSIRTLFGNAIPRLEENGSVLWHGFITDISERKKAEEKLYNSERFFNTIFNSQNSEIAILDETGMVIQVNQKWREFANAKASIPEMICEGANYLLVCDATTGAEAVYAKAMAEGIRSVIDRSKTTFTSEYPCNTPTEELWFSSKVTHMDGYGFTRILVVIDNITERILNDRIIKENYQRYNSMVSNISDVIGIMGADGLMKYKSANIEKFFGWLAEDRIGSSGFSTIHPDDIDYVQKVFYSLLEEENSVKTMEFRYECKDGTYKPIELTAANLMNDPVINGVLLNYRDISERKKNEEKIKLQYDELQENYLEKDKFFSIISHDLRGPLGGFMGLTEMMAAGNQFFSDTEKIEMMLSLSNSARNTFNLLENLLAWSKMKLGLTEFKAEKLDLNALLLDCKNIVAESARKKMIAINLAICNEAEVTGDKNMLPSVLRNLVSNAIKFTPHGGSISITADRTENSMMVVSVKDTGIGMSEKMLNDLFHIDASTKRPGTEGEQSSGLGLLLCKEFVEKQGGKIWVESEQNKGSVFSFSLPCNCQNAKEIASTTELRAKPEGPKNKLKILIAEDDEPSAKYTTALVKNICKEVINVKTGSEAVEACRNHPDIDLVLMDIAMPIMDGFEACRQIREFNQKVCIFAQTTFVLKEQREKAIEVGCMDYISKPINKNEIVALIEKYIGDR
ncbi:MAG: PAS domain S-box protein [Bacteroidota bacterium]